MSLSSSDEQDIGRRPPLHTTTTMDHRIVNNMDDADDIIQKRIYEDLNMFSEMIIKSDGLNRIQFWNHFEVCDYVLC